MIHPSRSRGNRTRLSLAGFGVMPWKSNTIAKVGTVLWIVSRFKPTGRQVDNERGDVLVRISSIRPSHRARKDPNEALGRFRDAITIASTLMESQPPPGSRQLSPGEPARAAARAPRLRSGPRVEKFVSHPFGP